MPLFGPMLLLILENVSAYALIQDYALIRTLRVINLTCLELKIPTTNSSKALTFRMMPPEWF